MAIYDAYPAALQNVDSTYPVIKVRNAPNQMMGNSSKIKARFPVVRLFDESRAKLIWAGAICNLTRFVGVKYKNRKNAAI